MKWLFVTLAVMLVTRLGIWLAYGFNEALFLQPDSHDYVYLGKQLFEEGLFPSFSRTPVYPFFLGVLDSVLGFDVKAIILVQIAISLLTACFAWRILNQFSPDSVKGAANDYHQHGYIAFALIFGLDFVSAQGANYLLSETIFTFLIVVAANLAMDIKYQRTAGWSKGILCGVVLGLATLCRPIAIFFPLVVMAWGILGGLPANNGKPRRWVAFDRIGVFGLVFVLSMSFAAVWMMRNQDKTGEAFLTTISSINLYEYRAAWNIAYRDGRSFDDVQKEFRERKRAIQRAENLNVGEMAKRMGSEGLLLIKETPVETMVQGGLGFIRLYFGVFGSAINDLFLVLGFSNESKGGWLVKIFVLFHVTLVYVGIMGLFISRLRNSAKRTGQMARENAILIFCGLIVGYFTLLSVGIEAYSRFRIPIMPLLGILSALGWSYLLMSACRFRADSFCQLGIERSGSDQSSSEQLGSRTND
ncbi:MAG: hypothetical protein GKR96_01520 [Gammaproteobacteria bacterium]|nr:hypothetical protein [Gammaproteobacteria bacterium]